jgi:molecular chaperone IbpA
VGYDRLANLLNATHRLEQGNSFPPYNIQKAGEDRYRITMAVAGFSEADLSITSENGKLVVTGEKPEEKEGEENAFLYRGIATRSFERRFSLADHVKVTGAQLDNGLLHIELEREIPEAMKPRKIEIESTAHGALLEGLKEDQAA